MKLDFGILWFDDLDMSKEYQILESTIESLGLKPRIDKYENSDQLTELSTDQLENHTYDLLMIDYYLGDRESGDDLAVRIRKLFLFTPILFYSNKQEKFLRQLMIDRGIEGVFCSNRDGLAEKASELIHDVVPSLNRITGMRGLAAQIVTEIDVELREIIIEFFGNFNSHKSIRKKEIEYIIDKKIIKNIKDNSSNFSKNKIADRINDRVVGSNILFLIFKELIEIYIHNLNNNEKKETLKQKMELFRKYPELVLKKRNSLVHVNKHENGSDDSMMQKSEYPEYRITLRQFRECIDEIKKTLFD